MAGICFYFESYDVDVWSGRTIDLDAWNYAAKAAGDIDKMVIVNKAQADIRCLRSDYQIELVQEIPKLEGRVVYVCCPWNKMKKSTSLWDFEHNVDWYVFGPAAGWKEEVENGIYIPQKSKAALHATHVASTILFHRYEVIKCQSS